MLHNFQSATAFYHFSLVLTRDLILFPHSDQNTYPDDLPTATVVLLISTMVQAACNCTRVSAGQYPVYFNITAVNVELFVRRQIGFLIYTHGTFNTTWGNPAMMALADATINQDKYLTRYFDKLNNLSPPLDLTSPTKLTARKPRKGWMMFTTFVADTHDKLVQIWKKAGITWPPMPLEVATPAHTVARPLQPAALVTAAPHTGWLDPKGTTVFQFFIVDPEMARNPMDYNSDTDDDESVNKPTDMYAWWNANNNQWLESMQNQEITSRWVLVEKVLWKVPQQQEVRVMYGATYNLSSKDKFPTIFLDLGLTEGGYAKSFRR